MQAMLKMKKIDIGLLKQAYAQPRATAVDRSSVPAG